MDSINGKIENSNRMKTYAEGNNGYIPSSTTNYLGRIQNAVEDMDFSATEEMAITESSDTSSGFVDALKKTGATIGVAGVSFLEGVDNFSTKIISTCAKGGSKILGLGAKVIDYFNKDNPEYSSLEEKLTNATNEYIDNLNVQARYDSFYENTAIGKFLKENSISYEKVRDVSNKIGFVASSAVAAYAVATVVAGIIVAAAPVAVGGAAVAGGTAVAGGAIAAGSTGAALIPAATTATSALVATGTETALAATATTALATTGTVGAALVSAPAATAALTTSAGAGLAASTIAGAAGDGMIYAAFREVANPSTLAAIGTTLGKVGGVLASAVMGGGLIASFLKNKKYDTDVEQGLEQIDSYDTLEDNKLDIDGDDEAIVNEDLFADESDRISAKSNTYGKTFGTEPTFTTGYQTAYDANSGENAKSLNTTIVFDGNSVIKNFKAFDKDGNMVDVPVEINENMSIDEVMNQAYETSKEMGIDSSNLIANVTDQAGNSRAWVKASDISPYNINNN